MISEANAASVRKMLEGVLGPGGTATGAAIKGYELAGKTGTAEKPDPVTGGYSKDKYVASFVGFAPARHPKLLVTVMVDEPKGEIYGGLVAGPAFKEITSFALNYLQHPARLGSPQWTRCGAGRPTRSRTRRPRWRGPTSSRPTSRCGRRSSARAPPGRSTARATPAPSPARRRRRSTAAAPSATRPRLVTHDRYGRRVDQVDLDPSWHWLLRGAVEREIHALPWREQRPGAHVARAALFSLWSQANAGVMCPVSMTYSAIPALRRDPALAAEWEPRLTLPDYERGALSGMAMTEKQGGSDVRANTTRAEPAGEGVYEITGHKWFCSAPMCDVFLVLAQLPAGLTCFLVEPGPGFELQRLKDKLGTRSLPSSEVEFRGVAARRLGEEGRGVPTIIEMVTHTRLDCVIGSAAGMRRGVAEAVNHARGRSAFGAKLADQPLMINVLADLAIESEAATATALRLARALTTSEAVTRPLAEAGTTASAASPPRCSSTGSASARRRTRSRRSSAWAATATSRRARCPSSCATRR